MLILACASPTLAQTEIWTGLSDSNWSNPLNWNPNTAYPNGEDAVAQFNTSNGGQTYEIGLGGDITLGALTIDSPDMYTVGNPGDSSFLTFSASSGTASLNAGTANPNTPQVINSPLSLSSDLVVSASNTLTLAGAVSGNGLLDISGTGTVLLSAVNNTGGLTIDNGVAGPAGGPFSIAVPLVVNAAGDLDLKGINTTVATITGAGMVSNSGAKASFTVNNAADCAFSGAITGPINFSKSGNGNLTLGGQSTYTGTTSILGGTVTLGTVNNPLPTGTTLTLGTGATLDLNGSNQTIASLAPDTLGVITDTSEFGSELTLTKASGDVGVSIQGNIDLFVGGPGTLALSEPSTYSGDTTITSGTVQCFDPAAIPNGTELTLKDNTTLDCYKEDVTVFGLIGPASSQVTNSNMIPRTFTVVIPDDTFATYSGTITADLNFAKNGAGTLLLNGANSYAGETDINNGALVSGVNNCLPVTTKISSSIDTTYDLNGHDQTIVGFTGFYSGIITNNMGGNTNTFTMTNAFGDLGVSFQGNLNLTTGGNGTLTLSAENFYSGNTTVTSGDLQVGAVGAIPGGTFLTLGSNTTFDLDAEDVVLGGISGDATTTVTNTNNMIISTLTLDIKFPNSTSTFNGTITGNMGLQLTGQGTLVLTGDNDYAPAVAVNEAVPNTIVNGGTLTINTPFPGSGTGDYPVAVNRQGTLNGSGYIAGSVTANPGGQVAGTLTISGGLIINKGVVAPGAPNAPGVIKAGGLMMDQNAPGPNGAVIGSAVQHASLLVHPDDGTDSGTYVWDLNALTDDPASGAFDVINVYAGNFDLGPATLDIVFSGSATNPDSGNAFWTQSHAWDIITLTDADQNITGNSTFSTLLNGTYNAGTFTTMDDGNGGVDLVWAFGSTSVPEPASFGLIAVLSIGLLARRRTRQPA